MTTVPWPGRPLLFTLLGGVLSLAIYFLVDHIRPDHPEFTFRVAMATAIATFGLVFAVVVRRDRWLSGIAFSLLAALVVGGIGYWRLYIDWPHHFNYAALAVALFVFSPFYQTSLHSKWNHYPALHYHAWSNAVVIPLGLLFVGLTFGMAYLIAELFALVGINALKDLLREEITGWVLAGASFGASLGVLREHDTIIASTQRLVQSVFSLLTTPLALGLGGFLVALPFTGLESLWNNTRDTSATLFTCALAALIFMNSVVREDSGNQSQNRFMQWSARLLALCLAPLAVISALAIKLRVTQYGWTPDRLWATVICLLLVVYGLFYLIAALRRNRFNETIRLTNVALAILVSVVALLLATPLFDFGEYSVKDQLTRLNDSRTTEDKFDLTAMAFDFGPAGRHALQDLREGGSEKLVGRINGVLNAKSRWAARSFAEGPGIDINKIVKVLNGPSDLPDALLDTLKTNHVCKKSYCYLLWTEDKSRAFLVDQVCHGTSVCRPEVQLYEARGDRWSHVYSRGHANELFDLTGSENKDTQKTLARRLDSAAREGNIEIRPVQRVQVFIDGKPLGPTTQ